MGPLAPKTPKLQLKVQISAVFLCLRIKAFCGNCRIAEACISWAVALSSWNATPAAKSPLFNLIRTLVSQCQRSNFTCDLRSPVAERSVVGQKTAGGSDILFFKRLRGNISFGHGWWIRLGTCNNRFLSCGDDDGPDFEKVMPHRELRSLGLKGYREAKALCACFRPNAWLIKGQWDRTPEYLASLGELTQSTGPNALPNKDQSQRGRESAASDGSSKLFIPPPLPLHRFLRIVCSAPLVAMRTTTKNNTLWSP